MDNLLPCPFCDDQLHLINHPVDKGIKGAAGDFVEHSKEQRCPLAHMSIPLSMWNRRAHLATPAANGPGEADGWTGYVALSDSENIVPFIGIHPDKKAIEKYYKSTFGHMLSEGGYRAQSVRILPEPSTPQPGMVTVPREPTIDMLAALTGEWHPSRYRKMRERYRAMLDAALRSGGRET